MSTTTIVFYFDLGAGPTDADTVELLDPTNFYGVRRVDTVAIVVAPGTAMSHDSVGGYSYSFDDPAPGLVYQYWVKATLSGVAYWFSHTIAQPTVGYLDVAAADALAPTVAGLTVYATSDSSSKAAALVQASDDIDTAMPYQGRRFEVEQTREFPRIAFDEPGFSRGAAPAVIWNWNVALSVAAVPPEVHVATLLQADSILQGAREPRLTAQHDGVVYDLTGPLAESYKRSNGPGVTTGLCRRAWMLMRRYRLRSGRII